MGASLVPRAEVRDRVLGHTKLVRLLRLAYSAERAAAFAYVGHAASSKDPAEKAEIAQIERDEWDHRGSVLAIMAAYGIEPSRVLEVRFWVIGKLISLSCHVIGWFMPYYFAGRLESGNVCEYFVLMRYFHEVGVTDHDEVLFEMGVKEKEHEEFFLSGIRDTRLLARFQRVFGWGIGRSYNDVSLHAIEELESGRPVPRYCTPEVMAAKAGELSWRARRTHR